MARLKQQYESDGFFGIGVLHSQEEFNIGTLWRSAYIMGASFIFTIDKKYKKQASDVTRAWTRIPLYNYATFTEFKAALPVSTQLIGIELCENSTQLSEFVHPSRAVYLLGNEGSGLPEDILSECVSTVALPGNFSLNVAVEGSIVLYDRVAKMGSRLPERRHTKPGEQAAP